MMIPAARTRTFPLLLTLFAAYLGSATMLWSAAPSGSYGVLLNQWPSSNTGSDKTSALLGVLTFDADGNVTATYTKVNRDFSVKTGTATGTSLANGDSSATINLTFDTGAAWTLSAAVTDKGAGLQLIVSGGDPMNAFIGNANPAEVWSGTGRTVATQETLAAGSYAFVFTGWPDAGNKPFNFLGVITLDGAGTLSGTYTFVNGRPTAIPGTFTGTYTVAPDSTGSMTLNLDFGSPATLAIVVTEDGQSILMLSSVGDQVAAGTARLQ